jgi:signal transduction histidine kinase/ActR/RegA family two-component response regulator
MTDEAALDPSAAQSLVAVSAALARGAPAEAILRHIAREVKRVSGADSVAVYQLDQHARALLPIAGYHVPKDIPEARRKSLLALSHSPAIAAALRTKHPVGSTNAAWVKGVDPVFLRSLPPHGALAVPMVVGGESVGILYLAWWDAAAMPREPAPVLPLLATSAGAALQSLLVGRDTVRKLQHTETLLAVSRALATSLDLYSVMRHLLRWTARMLGSDMVGAYALQEDGEWLVPVQGYRLPPDRVEALRRLKLSVKTNAFYASGAAARRAMFAPDVFEEAGLPDEIKTTIPHRAQMFVPIVAKDHLVGGLVVLWVNRAPEVQPEDIALIESIATQAGVVVENARLFDANTRQVAELSSLHDLARNVTGELERTAILQALHEPLRRGLSAEVMELYWRGHDDSELQLLLRIVDGRPEPNVPRTVAAGAAGLAAVVAREGQPILTQSYTAECATHGVAPAPDSATCTHWLGVPALAGGQTLGVLAVTRRSQPFTATHENFLSHAAQLVALALRTAAVYEDRVRINEELVLAQEHLVRSERLRALGEMASGIAHDFNNLLAAILGRAQLLQQHVKDARLKNWLRVIEQSALDGSHTVRRLQEFTRVRKDRPLAPVDLTQIVEDAISLTEPQWRQSAARRGVQIALATDLQPVPVVLGAAPELREVMTNLILNGLDAMPQGGKLTLTTARAGDRVVITIADTGVGMTDEVKRHLFDPFFTTKGPRGTGLGLSVTYGIVTRHSGHIEVASTPGVGTVFTLTFPVATEIPATDAPETTPTPTTQSLRCLVVDDENDIAEAIQDILHTYGHDVITSDAGAALDHVQSGNYDVVITDLAMPGITGWQVSEAVKRQRPDVPVILMSGFGIEIDADERKRQRIDAVLPKPIAVDDLLTAVATVIAQRGRSA